jgi:hypothetical protein
MRRPGRGYGRKSWGQCLTSRRGPSSLKRGLFHSRYPSLMTFTDSNVAPSLLGSNLHWCGHCRKWREDCEHCVDSIQADPVPLRDWQLIDARYDRKRQILELTFNTGDAAQFFYVPRSVALSLVKSANPGTFYHSEITGKYRFAQVRRPVVNLSRQTCLNPSRSASPHAHAEEKSVTKVYKFTPDMSDIIEISTRA